MTCALTSLAAGKREQVRSAGSRFASLRSGLGGIGLNRPWHERCFSV
jgi:hypothetical protein